VTELPGKAGWRAWLLARRRALGADERAAAAGAVASHVLPRVANAERVAAYVPAGPEPGSLDLLDRLRTLGIVVLLPVVGAGGELDWAAYEGRDGLAAGPFGLREPRGRRLGGDAVSAVDVVLAPALAADHAGIRLGRGGGYYDRALVRVRAGVPVVALLHDGELVPRLPADPWDRTITTAVTPASGWTELPLVAHHGH